MSLSYENEQRAASVLAHYLREGGIALGNEDAADEGRRAARNIRAAFEALEKGASQASNSSPELRQVRAAREIAEQRLSRELPPEAAPSQPSLQKGQSEDAHRS